MTSRWCGLVVLVATLAGATARADTPRFQVTAPAGCGDAPAFLGMLHEFLSADVDVEASGISAMVSVEGDAAAGYELTLVIAEHGAPLSQRSVRHRTNCPLLVRIAALIVSMDVAPDSMDLPVSLLASEGLSVGEIAAPSESTSTVSGTLPAADAPRATDDPVLETPSDPSARSVDATPPVATGDASARPRRVTSRVHALLGADAASTGRIAPSFGLGAGVAGRGWLADATLVVDGPSRIDRLGNSSYRTRVVAMTLELAACARLVRGRLALAGCPRLDVGFVQAALVSGAASKADVGARIRASGEARVGFVLRPGRLELEVRGFVGGSLLTPNLGTGTTASRPLVPRLDGGASLGVALGFP